MSGSYRPQYNNNNRYGNNNNNNNANANKAAPKIIYAEDDVFAGKTETGFYLFHSTLNPDEKYKQRRIGLLSEKPEKQYIEETIKYGQMGEKIKWRLNKEKLQDWIHEEFGFTMSEQPSPWAPKKIGVATPKKTVDPDDDDEDTETSSEPAKKKAKTSISNTSDFDIEAAMAEQKILLMECITQLRQLSPIAQISGSTSTDINISG